MERLLCHQGWLREIIPYLLQLIRSRRTVLVNKDNTIGSANSISVFASSDLRGLVARISEPLSAGKFIDKFDSSCSR